MKYGRNETLLKDFMFFLVLASMVIFIACFDYKAAGGVADNAGQAIRNLNVAGVSQKGPFVKGSPVSVQGINCRTMKLTGENFDGFVNSGKGDFDVRGITLSSPCALFGVTGYYLNEITGKPSSEMVTLHAITDLSGRKNVNINLFTQLEYERVMHLVTEKKLSFAEAKKLAEKDVLAAFGVEGEFALSEDLDVFGTGDGNAALLAVSVLVQVTFDSKNVVDVAERVSELSSMIAKNGKWNEEVKNDIANWASFAMLNGQIDSIRKKLEGLDYVGEVPAFENVVEKFVKVVSGKPVRSFFMDDRDAF